MKEVLLTVTSDTIVEKAKKMGITRFVYPLSSFCVGCDVTFDIEDIKEDGYLLVNRVLDCNDVDKLEQLIKNIPSNIKGFIFEDLALIELLKDTDLEKILYYKHFNTNSLSVKAYFKYVDEIILSSDITEEEMDKIISNSPKKVSLYVFGLTSSFYSRRHLLRDYASHYNINETNPMLLENTGKKFLAFQNEYGTVLYHYPYYDGTRLLKKDAKYYFYFPMFLTDEEVLKVLEGDLSEINTDFGFLDTKTIYKVK